jgi:hypothetical protein
MMAVFFSCINKVDAEINGSVEEDVTFPLTQLGQLYRSKADDGDVPTGPAE